MIATAQFTISIINDGHDGQDGVGIQSSTVSYTIYPFNEQPQSDILIDENGNVLKDENNNTIYNFLWSNTIPEVIPDGWYLWSKTTLTFSDGTESNAYAISRDGKDGKDGEDGESAPKIIRVTAEYRISNSSDTLTGNYDWSEERPELESGKYLWTRVRSDFDDGSIAYSDAVCDITISGIVFDVNRNTNSITSKVWESDIESSINEYDGSTGAAIRNRVTQTETDISGINSTVTSLQTTVSTKADGSTVEALTSRVSASEQDVAGFKQTVSTTYATKVSVPEFIVGTQTAATNVWLGKSNVLTSLTNGQQITYWLPFDGNSSGATLNLTLANNTTTGAIPCYYGGTSRITTHYPAGSIIHFTYRTNVTIGTTSIASGWWGDANYDSNNVDRVKFNGSIKAKTAIARYSLVVSDGTGYYQLNSGNAFGVNYPILYMNDNSLAVNATGAHGYTVFPVTITTTQALDMTPGLAVYIKGTLSGLTFTPISTASITQTIPTSEDNYHYMLLGVAYGTTTTVRTFYLQQDHPIYIYRNGLGFVRVETAALTVAEQTAEGFKWIVKSGTNETNFELTDRTATLVSNYINLNGLVTFSGLNTATQNTINTIQSTANQAASDATTANNTINSYKNANEVIIGTQTSATAVFKGTAKFSSLTDGQQITYWLPFAYASGDAVSYTPTSGTAASGAALQLTLSNGTNTAVIPCFYSGISRLTTHYGAGNVIRFVYRENVKIGSVTVTKGWWADANYDTGNTYDRVRYQQNITASSAITYNNLIVGYNSGYHNLNNGAVFDITYPILWCGATLDATKTGNNNYLCIPFSSTATQNSTWTAGKPVYIKGTLSGSSFTPVSTTPLTQTIPTSDDSKYYILVGSAYSTTGIYLTFNHDIYRYYNGAFKSVSQIATEAAVTATTANNTANANQTWIQGLGTKATDILASWTDDATLATTTIDGGYIKTHTIESQHLATDAIMSSNYVASGNANSPFSGSGTFLDLSNGNFYTPNFGIDNSSGSAYLNGEIIADSGSIGSDSDNYWEIGTKIDYNGDDSAALIGHGTSYVQSGWWQISNDRVNTQQYDNNHKITYIHNSNKYWDYGMQIPSYTSTANGADAWLYIRRSKANSIPTIQADWDYLFKVDKDGNVYENGTKLSEKYASISDVGSAYLLKTGGTISGNLTVTGILSATASSASSLTHSLSINGISWSGSSNSDVGTIGVGYGGTGVTSWTANRLVYSSASNTLANFSAGTSGQVLKSNGDSSAPSWVNQSSLSVGSATKATNDSDNNKISTTYRKLSNNTFEQIAVTGTASFTGGISGDLTGNVTGDVTGNASSATKVGKSLIIKLNSGTTEGTNMFTYDGSGAKTVNITKSSIGLSNVNNTADANKAVASAGKLTTAVNIQIGSETKSFDGSSGITFTLANIGAQPAGSYVSKSGDTITGTLVLSKTTDLDGTKDNSPALIVGGTASQQHIEIDGNEIHSKSNATTVGELWLNNNGGTVHLGPNVSVSGNTITATTFSGNATSATTATTAGSLTTGRDFTVGKTTKTAVKWDSAVSFTQEEISDCATNTADGWMRKEDKEKLDSITVSNIGRVAANSIVGEKDVKVTITDGVATIGHANSAITAGTASGTSNSGNLAFGATVTLPSITFDSYGHITGKSTTTFKLPAAPTTITGNAGTATKLKTAVNISVGKSTKSFDGSSAISFATKDLGIIPSDIKVLATKTYTGWLGTSSNNAANDSFYFMKVRPDTYNSQWILKYKIHSYVPGNTNFYSTSFVTLYGYGQATVPAFSIFNTHYSGSYRPYYYHNFYRLNATGYNNNCWNAVGLGLRGSNSRDTSGYERTVIVEVLDAIECSYELLDSGVKWANWESAASNYAGLTEYDGSNQGLRESGDDNDTSTQRAYYARLTAGSNGIKMYSLIMKDSTGKWQSFTTNSGTGNTKTKNTSGFVLSNIFYMNRSSDIAANGTTGDNQVTQYNNTIDLRYSTNCATNLVANQPVFIKGTMSNGLFYLADTWWTQTVPTSNDGFVYIPIGTGYNNYSISFMTGLQPIYHNGTSIVPYFEAKGARTAEVATSLSTSSATSDGARPVWFSQLGNNTKGAYNTNFTYNPNGNVVKATTFDGNATTATKATKDGSGNVITSTYIPYSGTTFNNPNANNFSLNNAITGNYLIFSNSGNDDGVAKGIGGVNGGSDGWTIRGYQTATNKGCLEISVGDDGDEGIYVRQYKSGGYKLPFMNLAGSASELSYREIVLMEPSTGNTKITVTTASTSKTTGALTVAGGVGVAGATHSQSFSVNDKVNITWNATTESLDFTFV